MNIANSVILALHVIVFIANSILGFTVVRAKYSLTNILFGVYAVSLALWNISLFLTITALGGPIIQLWCSRLAFSFYLLMINSFFFFTISYPGGYGLKKWLNISFWLVTAILFFLTLTPLLVKGNIQIIDGFITGELGPLMSFFSWYYVALIIFSIIILVRKIFKYRGLARTKIWYTLAGFFVFAAPMILTNIILPVFFGIFNYNSLGPIFSFPMLVIIARVIIRHRFMDIRQAVARLVTYSFLIVSLSAIYATGVSLATYFIVRNQNSKNNILAIVLFAVIITFSFQPLRDFFERVTNRIFFRHHYDENRLLYTLALIMSSSLRLDDLGRKLLHKLLSEMHINCGALILANGRRILHISHEGYKCQPDFSSDDLCEMTGLAAITIFEELPESRLKKIMRKFEIHAIIPLKTRRKKDNILILGEKLSGEPYSEKDIRVFEIFAPTAAVAIANTLSVEQIIQLDELKSEFITVVSHQLRTPLSVARWNFELLLEGAFGKLLPKVKDISQNTYKALMDLNRGLNNLMIALEIEEGKVALKYDEVDFNKEIVKEALSSLEKDIKAKKIKISKKLSFTGSFLMDRHKILEIVEALLANAIEYSPTGSTVEISTSAREENGRSELLFSIRDQGIGVETAHRDLIFQKFFRGEEAKKKSPNGFGLSLFIAKALIYFHKGHIWLVDKPAGSGAGAEFRFSLPVKIDKVSTVKKIAG